MEPRLSSSGTRGSDELILWDAISGERLSTLNEPSAVINAVAWSLSGSVLVSGRQRWSPSLVECRERRETTDAEA